MWAVLTRFFETALENCGLDILKRGYRILIDKIEIGPQLQPAADEKPPYIPLEKSI